MSIIKNQANFFDRNAVADKPKINKESIFYKFTKHALSSHFYWIGEKRSVLEYGCGVGNTLDLYLEITKKNKSNIVGVDISQNAINEIQKKYPQYKFYKIINNKIPQIEDASIGGCYLINVLHHTHNHREIFREIYKKLSVGGRFLIRDLSSNNLIIRIGRKTFCFMPNFIKNKFSNDLVVNGDIPEKYKVDTSSTILLLKECGFEIEKIDYGGLFIFIFEWLDKIFKISNVYLIKIVINYFIRVELFLLKYKFFNKRSEIFYIRCIKK